MEFASLFSGIGGFDLGFERVGMNCVLQVEQEKNCLSLLNAQWPKVPKIKDVHDVKGLSTIDVICGGFPCQDLSVAGKRKGLSGERSGLWYEFHRILQENSIPWVIIENVPGLLSSNNGRDMLTITRGLEECGYRWAYRVLDLQYWGVPQRRRRVFIVGHLGDGGAAEVLFESQGVPWYPQKGREKRSLAKDVAGCLDVGSATRDVSASGFCIQGAGERSLNVNGSAYEQHAVYRSEFWNQQSPPCNDIVVAPPVGRMGKGGFTCPVNDNIIARPLKSGGNDRYAEDQDSYINTFGSVRRLTPTECERLQGFPDGWTKGFPDTTRYKMLGNAVGVPVAKWIGRRIMEVQTWKT